MQKRFPQKLYKTLHGAAQYILLTYTLFLQNDLLTYAAAGAYGFLCSLIPIILMGATVLIRFFRTSPEILASFFSTNAVLDDIFDLPQIISATLQVRGVGIFEIIVAGSIIWMARRFFLYVMSGFNCIFRPKAKPMPYIVALISIAFEMVLVVAVTLLLFVLGNIHSLLTKTGLINYIPFFLQESGARMLKYLPAALIFAIIMLTFRFASGCRPAWRICSLASLGCTGIFWLFDKLFQLFSDMSRYNLIYGVLSNVIVMLLKVYVFFILLFFFAQFVFVSKYNKLLLFEQIYLLPTKAANRMLDAFIRLVFIKPKDFAYGEVRSYDAGEPVYKGGGESGEIYYVLEGSVKAFAENHVEYYPAGAFFGDVDCTMRRPHKGEASAETATRIIAIPRDSFKELLDFSPAATQRLLEHLSREGVV